MIIALSTVGALYLIGVAAVIFSWRKAPVGFEDKEGFHYGAEGEPLTRQPAPRRRRRVHVSSASHQHHHGGAQWRPA